MNYYRRYIGDYQRDTQHLTMAEHGAYTLLLDAYYAQAGDIPLPLSALNRICRATTKTERDAVQKVAGEYFPANGDGTRHNRRADIELAKADTAVKKMQESGRKGAIKRWGTP
jgi:uncharacterized protein YdaU (DUF1376 family)